MPPKRRRSGRCWNSWPGSISPWKMWPPVMPKRSSSCAARAPAARRSGRAGPGRPRRSARSPRRPPRRRPRRPGSTGRRATARACPRGASESSAAVWQAASIHGLAAGPPGARVVGRALQVVEREADVDRAVPRLLAGPAGKSGRPSSSSITFTTGPGLAASPAGARRRPGRAVRTGSAFERRRAARTSLAARPARRPRRAVLHAARARPARRSAPARPRPRPRERSAAGHRAHPAAREAPRARDGRHRLSQVVVEADEGRARVVGPGERADQPLDARTARAPPPTGCRPARRRSARRGSPRRPPRASARGPAARASAAARARRRRPSARANSA